MTTTPLTEAQLRAQVAAVRAKLPKARFIGVRAPAWNGPVRLRLADGEAEVVWCVSALAMAERMAEAPRDGMPLILITDRAEDELSTDILVRLAKRKLLSVDPWRVVLDLFQAREVDPLLAKETWMAEALLEGAPPEGYAAVASGVLDRETAWSKLLERFGFQGERIDDEAVLRWTVGSGPGALANAPEPQRTGILAALAERSGAVGAAIIGAVRSGHAADAVAIGLAARVIFGSRSEPRLVEPAVRLEPLCGGVALSDEAGRRWAELSERLAGDPSLGASAESWGERASAVLSELRAGDHARRSAFIRGGFEQRIEGLGNAVLRALGGAARPGEAEAAAQAVAETRSVAGATAINACVAMMASRLLRYLAQAEGRPAPGSFAAAMMAYCDEGAWADRARTAVGRGVPSQATMTEACRRLAERVLAVRERENRQFARLLADFIAAGASDQRIIPVEDIVAQVVAPLATKSPVLLLVLDAMSISACLDIVEDVDTDWQPIALAGSARFPVGLALLPTVTEVSRTSLFAGAVCRGSAADETRLFAQHAALRGVTRAGHPPVVFHKAEVTEAGRGLANDVRDGILSPRHQVVAVVVNAIDDHLTKGEQIPVRWGPTTIGPLPPILDAARQAGRIVVLTSDHGHVDGVGMELRRHEGGGSRWRPAVPNAPAAENEILLEGPRVLADGTNRVIAPATELVRYGVKQSGYHGGATPQEAALPLVVLSPAGREIPEGWVEQWPSPPGWWEPEEPAPAVPRRTAKPPRPAGSQVAAPSTPRSRTGQLELLAPSEPLPSPAGALLVSPVYTAQRKRLEHRSG